MIASAKPQSREPVTFGSFLRAIVDQKLTAGSDEHATAGFSNVGIAVPRVVANQFFERVYSTGEILSRVRRLLADPQSDGTDVPTTDETSRADGSRFGGVASAWRDETATVDLSRARFSALRLSKRTLIAACAVTNDLLRSPMVDQVLFDSFVSEMTFKIEDAIVNSVVAMQGVIHSPATIEIVKETAQPADTIVPANCAKMWARLWGASRPNAVWLASQECDTALASVDWSETPGVYKASSDLFPGRSVLFGRPILPCEYSPVLGDRGDLLAADFNEYALLDGGVTRAVSADVRFTAHETLFKLVWEVSGMVGWRSPVTPKNGGDTLSPFVCLEARG